MAAVAQRSQTGWPRSGIAGNLCRCTGYEAIYRFSAERNEDSPLSRWRSLSRNRWRMRARSSGMARTVGPARRVHRCLCHATSSAPNLPMRVSSICTGIGRIASASGTQDEVLRIGALTTLTEIRSSHVVRELPILAAAAGEIGGVQPEPGNHRGEHRQWRSCRRRAHRCSRVADAIVVLRARKASGGFHLPAYTPAIGLPSSALKS